MCPLSLVTKRILPLLINLCQGPIIVRMAWKTELSFSPTLLLLKQPYQEADSRQTEILNMLQTSRTIPQIMHQADFSPERRVKLSIFNHGSINVVGLVRVAPLYQELPVVKDTYGLDIPLAIAVISRRDQEGLNLTGLTVLDNQGLRLVSQRQAEFFTGQTVFRPTAAVYETLIKPDLAIMLNEAVGAVNQPYWGSAEVNFLVYHRPDKKLQAVFGFNPYTPLHPDRFAGYFRTRGNLIKLKRFDEPSWQWLEKTSSGLAAGYVAALTQVWFLTGKVPQEFACNSGDGVFDASLASPGVDFPQVAPIKLITIRGGFQDREMRSLGQFKNWVLSLKDRSFPYDDQLQDKKIRQDQEIPCFSQQNFNLGSIAAFTRMFDRKGVEYLQRLIRGEELTKIWQELNPVAA